MFEDSISNIANSKNQVEKNPAFYRKSMVLKKVSMSSSTLDRLVKKGLFPKPFVIGEPGYSRSVGWSAEEVEAWINSRPRVTN